MIKKLGKMFLITMAAVVLTGCDVDDLQSQEKDATSQVENIVERGQIEIEPETKVQKETEPETKVEVQKETESKTKAEVQKETEPKTDATVAPTQATTKPAPSVAPTVSPTVSPSGSTNNSSGTPGVTVPKQEDTEGNLVWVPVNGGKKYHSNASCSGMENPIRVTLEHAQANGYTACKRCH